MPDVTIAPSTEACEAIRDRINSGTTYALAVQATISEQFSDDQQTMDGLMIDVVSLNERQLVESLATEDPVEVTIGVEIRKKLSNNSQMLVDALKLIVQKVFQRLNLFRSSNARVQVWKCAFQKQENPNKKLLAEALIFRSRIEMQVEVAVPA